MKIGFIGVGELTEKLIRGLMNINKNRQFYLSPRSRKRVSVLSEMEGCTVMRSNQAVIDQADIVIIGIRPEALTELADEVQLRPDQTVISLLAGTSSNVLQTTFSPAKPVRLMMTYSAEINKTTVVLSDCSDAIKVLFSDLGEVITTSDDTSFELATVGMCMNGWLYSFAAQLQGWFTEKGMSTEQSRTLVLSSFRECAEYAAYRCDCSLGELAKSIATPGTYTALGQEELDKLQAAEPWINAADSVLSALVKK
ncbi:NAD(P)-binding domain-containing protein [Kosakonia cowanii]|uniref:NAD(P)-binding domain-containing protein n=1 Tax=Kosakonia cowanii TaxID=208223 RepID=UPI0012FD0046|nr:NAD(P)-binding domain-containing protein [Kosakonia cowanii]